MPGQIAPKLTKRAVAALAVTGKDAIFWDWDLPGFGVRVYASGRKVFVVQSRGPRRATLGRHGRLSADQARKQAADVIDRIKRGKDPFPAPAEPELTVAGLAERYMQDHVAVNCREKTQASYRYIIDAHILPELGDLAIGAVDRARVAALHYRLRETPQAANAAVNILSKMFILAEGWSLRANRANPCRFVEKYKEHEREQFLTEDEFRRLDQVLSEVEAGGSETLSAVTAIRLLMLTGSAGWARSRRCVGRTWTWRRASCCCGTPRRARGRFRSCRRRPGCSPARAGQPLGDPRPQAGRPSAQHRRTLAAHPDARRAQ